jgi:hypothetical protein
MKVDTKVVYEFGPFRMDPDKQVLLRDGQLIAVTPKAFETLLVLVRRLHLYQGVSGKLPKMRATSTGPCNTI